MNGGNDKPNGRKSYLSDGFQTLPMRLLLSAFLFAFCIQVVAQSKAGFTLDELQLKRYDSKKKYPATVLRNEPDAYPDLIPVKIYQGKSLYTGKIIDEKGSLKIEATVNDGSIVDFSSWDSEATRRQSFHVSTNGMMAWTATDSVYYDNQLFSSGMYFRNNEGNVMMLTRIYEYDNHVLETSYRIGTRYGDEIEYNEPLQDGLMSTYHNGNLLYYETFVDGQIDGECVQYDENKTVLQRYFVNASVGLYGTYYEYDTATDIVTIGHYNDRGVETGQWISKYADSSLAAIHWISETGNPDSMKVWDVKGNLVQVGYNYWRSSKAPGVNDYIHYEKSCYSNGQVHLYTNYNPGVNDTIRTRHDVTGILLFSERNMNGRIQTRIWNTNGTPRSERYGVPSGIAGVTVRDSVYRVWSSGGETVIKECYYEKGKFIRSSIPIVGTTNITEASYGPAYNIAVTQKPTRCNWDSCSLVPSAILDSLAYQFDNAWWCARIEVPESAENFQRIRDIQGSVDPEYKYQITLTQQEFVKLDSSGKIVTKNPALNQFLDSLHLLGLGVAPLGNYTKKKSRSVSDYCVTTTDVRYFLNLFYVNRRLEQLAPGSSISLYTPPTTKLAPEIIYIPQGEKTSFGITPVTVIAVAGEGSTRELKVAGRTIQWDNRPFYVFNVYGDGDVEFARTTYKDTILLQYRGERTGVYAKPQ